MKALKYLLVMICLGATTSSAQISVVLESAEKFYLPGEAVLLDIKVTNFSGQTLTLATAPDWVQFTVEAADGYVVHSPKNVYAPGEFEVANGFVATRKVNIGPNFDFSKPGRYLVSCLVRVDQLAKIVYSPPIKIEVLAITPMWERNFGVPQFAADGTGATSSRRYSLIQITRNSKPYVYVTTSEIDTGKLRSTIPLTRVVTFNEPDKMLDDRNNLHVLCQSARIEYTYSVINPDGKLVVRQTFEQQGNTNRPRLAFNHKGLIEINGGIRLPNDTDVPELIPNPNETAAARRIDPNLILPGVSIPTAGTAAN